MKKQFITGVLLLAVTAFGFSTFTSCKDTDEDLYNGLQSEQVKLKASMEATLKALQEQLDKLKDCPTNCQAKIDSLKQELTELINKKTDYDSEDADKQIKDSIDSIMSELEKLYLTKSAFEEVLNGDNGIYSRINAINEALNTQGGTLESVLARIEALENKKDPTIPDPADPQFTDDEVKSLLEIIALQAQLEGLFGENGTLAGITSTLGDLTSSV
ncbi:MAG: hypothetical protein K2J10_10460, partial [Muribaculaceae bacterium]|nr:hypothetical protein [Muribaculaceae bacterium]